MGMLGSGISPTYGHSFSRHMHPQGCPPKSRHLLSTLSIPPSSSVLVASALPQLSELGAGGLVEMVGYFRQELQEAEFEILQLSAQVGRHGSFSRLT